MSDRTILSVHTESRSPTGARMNEYTLHNF